MTKFAEWLLQLIKDGLKAAWDFITDLVIGLVELLLQAVLALVSAIPVPAFMSTGLNTVLGNIPSDVWFFAGHFKLTECMAILGAAVAFRLARKAVTLGQW